VLIGHSNILLRRVFNSYMGCLNAIVTHPRHRRIFGYNNTCSRSAETGRVRTLLRRIEDILATREQITLSDEAVAALTLRRLQQIQRGPWVEGRYGKRRRRTR
jgi:hypothetical protein